MEDSRVGLYSSLAIIFVGIALAGIHYGLALPGAPHAWLAAAGSAAPYIGVGAMALIGVLRSRPELCFAAGVALIPMSLISFATYLLAIPAGLLIWQAVEHGVNARMITIPAAIGVACMAVLGIIVFHQDAANWTTPEGAFVGSSNIITVFEATVSLGVAAGGAVLAWQFSRQPRSAQ